jgi:ribonucleoside-diphosphate reductase alpha chain
MKLDYSRDALFDEIGLQRLKDSYMMDGESSPQERYAYVSKAFGSNEEHAQRLYDYASKHWLGYSTPVLSYGRNKSGMPISCFLVNVPDSKEGLVDALSETNWLSMLGGGVGVYFNIRGADEKSVGVIPHMKVYDDSSLAYKQGTTRRGSYAMYIDISHPDIIGFLEMRKETGDQNRRCLNLHHGVNIPDSFMQIIENCMRDPSFDDSWELKDPASGKVHETVSAKALWASILELRAGAGRGEPYIHFIDNVNNAVKPFLKERGYYVSQSNLCLRGDTTITVEDSGECETLPISEFVVKWEMGFYSSPRVKTYKDGYTLFSPVSAAAVTGKASTLIRIETEAGKVIECTTNHLIFTKNRGWVEASDLKEDDELVED